MSQGLVFLFTGQGAQHARMGRQLFRSFARFRGALEQVAAVLDRELGEPLLPLIFDGDEQRLQQTSIAQPALFAIEVALLEVLKGWGVTPSTVMGHSLGEITAAYAAGALDLPAAARMVVERGRLMQQQRPGRMLAARVGEQRARELLAPHAASASLAAINGPEATVFSGAPEAIGAIESELARLGIAAHPLAVSHAFHSPLMDPMLERFKTSVRALTMRPTRLELISNLTGQVLPPGTTLDADYWTRHVREPVRYHDGIAALQRSGKRVLVELGPHPVLLGMLESYWQGERDDLIATLRRDTDDWAQLVATAAALQARGHAVDSSTVDWTAFYSDYREYATRQAGDAVGLITRQVPDPRHALGIDKAAYDLVESSKGALRGSTFELVSFGFDKDRHYLYGIRGPTGVRYLFFDWYSGGTVWLAPTPWAEATRVMQRALAYDVEARTFKSLDGQTPQGEAFVRGLQDAFATPPR